MTTQAQPQDAFDEAQYLNDAQQDTFDTSYTPTPEGDFAMAVKQGSTKIIEGTGKDGRVWKMYTSKAVIDDAKVREETNVESPSAQVKFFLDLTDDGKLASGKNKNVALGRLLAATGNNKPGWSYAAIEGVPFLGGVKHRQDADDSTRVYADVVRFAKL